MKIIRLCTICSVLLLAACQTAAPTTAVPQATMIPAGSAQPLASWRAFESTEGGFSVMMPEEPTPQTQSVDTAAGKVDYSLFMSSQGNNIYGVSYNDLPADVVKQVANAPQAMLESSRDGVVHNVNGQVVSSKAVTLGSNPGIDFVAEIPVSDTLPGGATYHGRTFLAGNRLYQVIAIATDKNQDDRIAAFFDSFKLTR